MSTNASLSIVGAAGHPVVIAYLTLLLALAGLALWAFVDGAKHPIAKRVGEYVFAIGTFWTMYSLVGATYHLFGG